MSATWAFRLALVFAVAMLAAIPFMAVDEISCRETTASGQALEKTEAPITRFQLARTSSDLKHLFVDAECTRPADLVGQVNRSTLVDTFAYLPAYAGFFVMVAYALGRRNRDIGWAAIALTIACAAADALENVAMFQLSGSSYSDSSWLTVLFASTSAKWVGLAVMTTLCGVMLARRGGWWRVALVPCAAPLVTSLWSLPGQYAAAPFLMPAMVIASTVLLADAIRGSIVREKSAPA